MALEKKLGTTLQTGVDGSGITGVHEQSGGRNAGGDVEIFYDKDGTPISVYLVDGHKEYSWTALMEASVADKDKGDSISVPNVTDPCFVTQWDVSMENNNVKRVNITARSLPGLVVTPAAQSQTNGGTGTGTGTGTGS